MFGLSKERIIGDNNRPTGPTATPRTVVHPMTPRYQLLSNQGSSGPPLNVVSITPASPENISKRTAALGDTPVADVQRDVTQDNGAGPPVTGDCSDQSERRGNSSEGCVASVKQGVVHFSVEQQKIGECNNLLSSE